VVIELCHGGVEEIVLASNAPHSSLGYLTPVEFRNGLSFALLKIHQAEHFARQGDPRLASALRKPERVAQGVGRVVNFEANSRVFFRDTSD